MQHNLRRLRDTCAVLWNLHLTCARRADGALCRLKIVARASDSLPVGAIGGVPGCRRPLRRGHLRGGCCRRAGARCRRPADQPTSRPADQPTSRPAGQPASRPDSQACGRAGVRRKPGRAATEAGGGWQGWPESGKQPGKPARASLGAWLSPPQGLSQRPVSKPARCSVVACKVHPPSLLPARQSACPSLLALPCRPFPACASLSALPCLPFTFLACPPACMACPTLAGRPHSAVFFPSRQHQPRFVPLRGFV